MITLHALEIPRHRRSSGITRLMVLAIRCDRLIQEGEISDYAELAWLRHVSRAGVTWIMNLLLLAPDIQEAILYMPRVESGTIRSCYRIIAAEADWERQRGMGREQ